MTHKKDVERYMSGVNDGSIVASRLVRLAVARHQDDVIHGSSRGLEFSEYHANRVLDFFPVLGHTTGEFAGESFEPRLFQKFILWVLFGWRRADGTRRFRWAFISYARGNGKSPIGAAIANYIMIADEPADPRAQVYCFATKEAQARDIVFSEAQKQIESCDSDELKQMVLRTKYRSTITKKPWNGSVMEPKGSDSKRSDGWILSAAIIDELHEWHDNQRGLLEKIETAMAKRQQPLACIITTAGGEDSVIYSEQFTFYEAVLEGRVKSDAHFAYIAEIDQDEACPQCDGIGCQYCDNRGRVPIDAFDEQYWEQANPMLAEPRSPVKIDELRSLAAKAKVLPSARNTFLRYHANQRVGSFYRLITSDLWAKGGGEIPELKNRPCHAGFDWGWRNDLASLVLVFPHEGQWYLKCWAWIPSGCDRDLHQEPWATWIQGGHLTVTDGDSTDINAIYLKTEELLRDYQILTVAADPNNCREYLTRLVNEWNVETYEFFQNTKKYNEPTRNFCEMLGKGLLHHGNNPLLTWCAGNVTVHEDAAGYIMPHKAKSQDKIDPIVAAIMGFSECMFSDAEGEWSMEETGL